MQPEDWGPDLGAVAAAWEARALSHDPDTQVGAALSCADGSLVVAANQFPAGVRRDVLARLSRPEKYRWIEHAERKALFASARAGISTEGATMHVTWFPCCDCARAAIDMGVREVVGQVPDPADERWIRWGDELRAAMEMLDEAGVAIRFVDYPALAAPASPSPA